MFIFDHAKNFDLCFVQETFVARPDAIKRLSSRWLGPSFWSPAIGKQGGTVILVSEFFSGKILSWRKDSGGLIVSLLVSFNGVKYNVVNIYAPTNHTDHKSFFETLHEFFFPANFLIIGGDFNCYEYESDKFCGNVSLAAYLTEFRNTFNLVDVWRKIHPRSCDVSWFNSDFQSVRD